MNQYRCETCKNHVEDNGFQRCKFIKGWVEPDEYYLITEIGCASHSDFQSERDKDLNEYTNRCKNGIGACPPQCLTSSGCPNLNVGDFDGEPENYPQDTFCKCPYREIKKLKAQFCRTGEKL
jgi:hypothetical protein